MGLEVAQCDARGSAGVHAYRSAAGFIALVDPGRRPPFAWRSVAGSTFSVEEAAHGNGRLSTATHEVAGSRLAVLRIDEFQKLLHSIQRPSTNTGLSRFSRVSNIQALDLIVGNPIQNLSHGKRFDQVNQEAVSTDCLGFSFCQQLPAHHGW